MRDDDRGAVDVDLEALENAAHQIAVAENSAVFHGWAKAGIEGIVESSPLEPIRSAPAPTLPTPVAGRWRGCARRASRDLGLALGPDEYTSVIETAEHGGYPLFDHLGKILERADRLGARPAGAVVMSLRGGDFLFESGQDLSIGYDHHDAIEVNLYLEESFSFVVATPRRRRRSLRERAGRRWGEGMRSRKLSPGRALASQAGARTKDAALSPRPWAGCGRGERAGYERHGGTVTGA